MKNGQEKGINFIALFAIKIPFITFMYKIVWYILDLEIRNNLECDCKLFVKSNDKVSLGYILRN